MDDLQSRLNLSSSAAVLSQNPQRTADLQYTEQNKNQLQMQGSCMLRSAAVPTQCIDDLQTGHTAPDKLVGCSDTWPDYWA